MQRAGSGRERAGKWMRRAGSGREGAGTSSERRSRAMANQIRTHKYTRAARTDSKWNKIASKFSKLLDNVFSMFYQILNFSKSYTKLLEMLW